MSPQPTFSALQKITESAHIPAVAYSYVEPKDEGINEYESTAIAFGKKNTQSTNDDNKVDNNTQFPASSLSKIVFTYLVLQLAEEKQIDLDEPLHDILPYERFMIAGEYPEKAKQLTARHVLSHTTGLPNFGSGSDSSSSLPFDPKSELGKGYSYSGEAFLYLQRVIEKKMGKDLETLAQEKVFKPLLMQHSTFLPSKEDSNVVVVHTELGKPSPIYVGDPPDNAAGSLLTTADDFSKFMTSWLEKMNDPEHPLFQQAFKFAENAKCGLGWHIYKDKDQIIAYQYGENLNTQSFVAINVNDKKGAAFFTNSEHGMSIANQVLSSLDLAPIGDVRELFKSMPRYPQSDTPGWSETLAGRIAEDQGNVEEARSYFEAAIKSFPDDESQQRRLEWFNAVHQTNQQTFFQALKSFEGEYKNQYGDKVDMQVKDGGLVYKQFDNEIKLMRVSENEFLPEKDQSFKINLNGNQMSIIYANGLEKKLEKQPVSNPQLEYKQAVKQLRESQHVNMTSPESSEKEIDRSVETTPKSP